MALWYLLNNVRVGTTLISAGSLLNDAFEDVAEIEAAGGRVVADTTPGVAAGAVLAQNAKRRGASPDELESLMNAAIDDAQQSTIVSSTSGVTSLTTRVSTEESTRASVDLSLTTRVSTEESTRASADLSLTTRVSTEESTRASQVTSITAGSPAYVVTNLTTDRTYDANATTTDELADVLGTLISDLRTRGVLG